MKKSTINTLQEKIERERAKLAKDNPEYPGEKTPELVQEMENISGTFYLCFINEY